MTLFRRKKEKGRKQRSRLRRLVRLAKWFLAMVVIGFLGLHYHFRNLDRAIEAKFDKPRKWDLPSRIYSDAEYLYPGTDVKTRGIIAKLDRLGYRNTGSSIVGPGDYAVTQTHIDIHLHDFDYPEERFGGFAARLLLEGNRVKNIIDAKQKKTLDLIRLEPEEISPIFNEAMENRTVVLLANVPNHLIEAIILIEDERFFSHGGLDPLGIARAMLVNLRHLKVVQGGSTLTQQLVKNFFLYPKRSLSRKINEMLIAYRIEKNHTKAEILEAYLNEIYLGQRGASSISGVQEASRLYFAKDVGQLTLGESAMLAGMIRSPSEYNPISKPQKAKARRDFVLKRMWEKELIAQDAYTSATAEPIITPTPKVRISAAPYFVDFVKRQIADLYPQELLQREGLRIFTTLDMGMQLMAERAVAEELALLEKKNSAILPADHAGKLESCLVALQPSTGFVRALVGGKDYETSQFDRCTLGKRQPGSTFKPFVYLTAMDPRRSETFFTPASVVLDESFEVSSGGKPWRPHNYDKKEHGPVTLAIALEQSMNIATAKVALAAGLEQVIATARDAGITSDLQPVPSLALGSFEVAPMEMASAYTIFPNGGIRAEPISIMNVVTKDGEVLEKKRLQMKRAFDAGPVFVTTTMMRGVIDRGTGAAARSMGFSPVAAGKTGTTSSYRDAWFCGFTPSLLSLVWVGFDDNAEMKMSGARAALPLWTHFMKEASAQEKSDFASPSSVVLVNIDPRSGGTTSDACPGGIPEAFLEGTEPTKKCDDISFEEEQKKAAGESF